MLLSVTSMLFLAASAVQSPPTHAAPAQPVPGSEIVVTARRLRDIRVAVKTRRKTGESYCKLRKSSGDRTFDSEFCAMMVNCHITVQNSAAMRTVRERGARRQEMERVWTVEATLCMAPYFERLEAG